MIKRLVIAASTVLLLAGNAHASSAGGEGGSGKDVGQYVDLLPVGLPIVYKGKLVNYIFVNLRLNLTTSANTSKLRDREPFFRDALVKAAHRTPFSLPGDLQHVDEPRLKATLMREATAIAGPGAIKSVTISTQASQKRVTPASLGF